MNIKKTTCTLMAAIMLVGTTATGIPALAAETKTDIDNFNTEDYVDEMLKAVEGYEGDVPMDIAASPLTEDGEQVYFDGGCESPFADEAEIDIDNFNTVDYVDEMLKAVEGYEGDVPMDIAANPMAEDDVYMDGGCCNPFADCADLDAAAQMTGFSLSVPSTPDWVAVLEDSGMIQADYESGMYIRKASGNGDISGDYNEYTQVETVGGVTIKGENGVFSLAIWKKDGYTYAVGVSEALSQADMLALVAEIR